MKVYRLCTGFQKVFIIIAKDVREALERFEEEYKKEVVVCLESLHCDEVLISN